MSAAVVALVTGLAAGACTLVAVALGWRQLFGAPARAEAARETTWGEVLHGRQVIVESQRGGWTWAAGLAVSGALLGMASTVASYIAG